MNYHDFAVELVKKGGAHLLEARGKGFETTHKGMSEKNVVTSVDLEVNQIFITAVQKRFPDHRISSEEGGKGASAGIYEWVLDPIDGSANFARGIPHFAVCVTLLESSVPLAGAVYNPVTRELFSFERGKGVFLNGIPVQVSQVVEPKDAQVIYILGHYAPLWDWGAAVYRSLVEHCKKLKALGSSALDLCFVAAGRADLVVYGTLTTRDCAGPIAMVREAGGEVYALPRGEPVELSNTRQTVVAVSTKELYERSKPLLHLDRFPQP